MQLFGKAPAVGRLAWCGSDCVARSSNSWRRLFDEHGTREEGAAQETSSALLEAAASERDPLRKAAVTAHLLAMHVAIVMLKSNVPRDHFDEVIERLKEFFGSESPSTGQ